MQNALETEPREYSETEEEKILIDNCENLPKTRGHSPINQPCNNDKPRREEKNKGEIARKKDLSLTPKNYRSKRKNFKQNTPEKGKQQEITIQTPPVKD